MIILLTFHHKFYFVQVLDNRGGELCNHYPSKLVILEYECTKDSSTNGAQNHESIYSMQSLTEMFTKARFARCRTRFVSPVILVEGKVSMNFYGFPLDSQLHMDIKMNK